MRKFNIWSLLIAFMLPILTFAKSSVWIAEKNNNKIILAGSVHLIHPSQLPLPEEYLKAFKESKRIAFEIDLAEMDADVVTAKIINTFKLKGTTLNKVLKPEVWQSLNNVLDQYNASSLVIFDAVLVSFSLPMIIWQQQGYQSGVDRILYDKARQERKIIIGLETFDEQLKIMASLKIIDPNIIIEELLRELNDPQMALDVLITALYKGNYTVFEEQIASFHPKEMETFYHSLLTKRNKAWIAQIDELAKDNISTMIVVGMMHLAGKDSVLQLLKERGYRVTYYE